jgi:serine/threonine protein kinase
LRHPHIAATHDFGVLADGTLYAVMELLEGPTLRQYLEAHERLPIAQALQIASQLIAAISAGNLRRVVHGDLTPANIIVTLPGPDLIHCKVVDYGLPKFEARSGRPGHAGAIIGTPRYMAPEQYAGQALDIRSDIFSVGVILYEMLAGLPPFPGVTPQQVLRQHRRRPLDLREFRPEVPARVQNLVATALELDPQRRWQTPSLLAAEISFAQRSLPPALARPIYAAAQGCRADTIELEDSTDELPILDEVRLPGGSIVRQDHRSGLLPDRGVPQNRRPPRRPPAYVAVAATIVALAAISWSRHAEHPAAAKARVAATPIVRHTAIAQPSEPETTGSSLAPNDLTNVDDRSRAALSSALNTWIAATNARDLPSQLAFYPARLERFYLWHDVPRHAVLAEKKRVFEGARVVRISVEKPEISLGSSGRTARMQFRKQYVIEGDRLTRRGRVLQELLWVNEEGSWKIKSERDLRVIS